MGNGLGVAVGKGLGVALGKGLGAGTKGLGLGTNGVECPGGRADGTLGGNGDGPVVAGLVGAVMLAVEISTENTSRLLRLRKWNILFLERERRRCHILGLLGMK